MKKPALFVIFFAALAVAAGAAQYASKEFHYSITLPSGWETSDASDPSQVVFANSDDDAAVVVGVFEAEPGLSSEELLQAVVDRLRLKGARQAIDYKGYRAVGGSFQFLMKGARLSADLIVFNTDSYYIMIMGSSLKSTYKKNRDDIKAFFDSFTLDAGALEAESRDNVEPQSATVTASSKTSTASAETSETSEKSKEYAMKVGWGDLESSFTFATPDYYAAVKEGQAIIASGDPWGYYGVDTETDPHYTETFWARFFQDMYDRNYVRVQSMVNWFRTKAGEKGWSGYELAVEVIKCVQAIPYERPYQVVGDKSQAAAVLDYFTPNEVAWYDKGDCDTKSMLLIMILRQLGYDLVLYFSESYQHAMAGINLNAKGTYKTLSGKKYYFIEVTYPGWNIGDLPEEFGDPAQWTVVSIN
ncbi:MAG: hypothetical protein JXD23_13290 [Spirochaetales bacterium]|nr:hypothetical protein [Spirochaetales bacterium]